MDFSGVRPLAVVFMPCRSLRFPEHVLRLPVLVSPYPSELPDLSIVETGSQGTWDTLNIPDHQILRITAPEDPLVLDKDSIDMIDSSHAYRVFSRLWSGDNNTSKGIMSTHALTMYGSLPLSSSRLTHGNPQHRDSFSNPWSSRSGRYSDHPSTVHFSYSCDSQSSLHFRLTLAIASTGAISGTPSPLHNAGQFGRGHTFLT